MEKTQVQEAIQMLLELDKVQPLEFEEEKEDLKQINIILNKFGDPDKTKATPYQDTPRFKADLPR
jgi:hypothetical protein